MQYLKQNSGSGAASGVTIPIGPCLATDGTEYTGLVIGDLTLIKNGTSAAMAANATLTHVSNGFYDLVTIGNNADTLGRADIRCNKSGFQIPVKSFVVVPAIVYDALVAGTDALQVEIASGGINSNSFSSNAITADTLDSDVAAELQAGLATAASIAALNNLSIANVRTAVGLASANLDTQLNNIGVLADAANDAAAAAAVYSSSVDTKLNSNFVTFVSSNTGGRTITNLTTPKNVVITASAD